MADMGKLFITIGVIFLVVSFLWSFLGNLGLPRLPGDIYIKKDGFSFYLPVVASILINVILTIILNLFIRK